MGNGRGKTRTRKKSSVKDSDNKLQTKQIIEDNIDAKDNIEVLDELPERKRIQRVITKAQVFKGPLPDPDTFQKYNQVCPGAADRILRMAENQSSHRQSMESKFLNIHSRNSLLGIIAAFIIGVLVLIFGMYSIDKGNTGIGVIFSGTGLVGIAAVFLKNTNISLSKGSEKIEENTKKET